MNTIKSFFNFFMAAIIASFAFPACDDEFTEKDLLKLQQEESEINFVTFDLIVYSTAGAQSAGQASAATEVIAGATVKLIQNDSSTTYTTDANGQLIVPEFRRGTVSIIVSATDHTTCYAIASVDSDEGNSNFSTSIYLFPTTIESGAAVIEGVVYAEKDFTNGVREYAEGATLSAFIDVRSEGFRAAYWGNSIIELNYSSAVSNTTVGADGTFSLVAPAGYGTGDGLPVKVVFDEYTTDQSIVFKGEKQTFGGIFGEGIAESTIPAEAGLTITAGAPSTPGTGLVLSDPIPQTGGMTAVKLLKGGSGYTRSVTQEIASDLVIGEVSPDFDQTTDFAHISVTTNNAGVITDVTLVKPGAEYLKAASFAEAINTALSGSGVELLVKFDQNYIAKISNGGTGYKFLPTIKYRTVSYNTKEDNKDFTTYSEVLEYSLANATISNGTIIADASQEVITFEDLVSAPEFQYVKFAERKEAKLSVRVEEGIITNVFLNEEGVGYDPNNLPSLTIAPIIGTGTGASIFVKSVDREDGSFRAEDLEIISGGSGYYQFGNNPVISAMEAESSLELMVKPGKTYNRNYDYGTGKRVAQEEASSF